MMSTCDLNGKIAFVTGGTRGIGWECARTLAQHGATLIINGHSDPEKLQTRVNELKDNFGTDSTGYLFDVSDYNEVKKCYAEIFKKYKRLDILVSNAGILNDSLIGMITTENIDRTFDVNVKGVIYNLQYASKLMGRNKSGTIINIASIIGKTGNEGQVVYGSSKSAVIGLTLSAAKELAAQNIRVNAIAPGFIDTDMTQNLPKEIFDTRINSIKMKRIGTPEDIAKAVLFFASELSEYITGQVLGVDGGMLI